MFAVSCHDVLRSMLVVPDVPAVLTAPGMYSVTAEKSSPFSGMFAIVFAVIVDPSVGSVVFKIALVSVTFTVVDVAPTRIVTLNVAVCNTSSANGFSTSFSKPDASTVT